MEWKGEPGAYLLHFYVRKSYLHYKFIRSSAYHHACCLEFYRQLECDFDTILNLYLPNGARRASTLIVSRAGWVSLDTTSGVATAFLTWGLTASCLGASGRWSHPSTGHLSTSGLGHFITTWAFHYGAG